MPFDPCGTRRLEGEDIINRLAVALGATPHEIKVVLEVMIHSMRESNRHE